VSTRTGAAAGIGGGHDTLHHSFLHHSARNGTGLTAHHVTGPGGGGTWSVASAAKLIFGRARSLSSPNPPSPTGLHTALRAPSPSPLGRDAHNHEHGSVSPPESLNSISIPLSMPMERNHSARPRLYSAGPNSSVPSLAVESTQSSPRSSFDGGNTGPSLIPITGAVKTLCNRGSAIVSVHLSEPVIYLTGFEPSEYQDRAPSILRGSLILKLLKPTKIKAITLTFRGRARTEWPEGIPPKKTEFYEEEGLMNHTWPFFNAQFSTSEHSHGADASRLIDFQRHSMDLSRPSMDSVSSLALSDHNLPMRSATPNGSPNLAVPPHANGMWGIPYGQARSVSKDENKTVTQMRGYRIFQAGEYVYVSSL